MRRRAAEWLARLWAEDVSPAEAEAFRAWLREDPEHADAFNAVKSAVDEVARAGRRLPQRFEHYAPAPRYSHPFAVGGCAMAVALAAFTWWSFTPQSVATGLGERRDVALWDGSTIELNTASQISYRPASFFVGNRRVVELQRGEALFIVASNRGVFDVIVDGAAVRAIGTMFSVRREPDGFSVIVAEGVVSATPNPDSRARYPLTAGQSFGYRAGQIRLERLDVEELRRSQSWRQGMLEFDGQPLSEVAAEVSRYTGAEFSFADQALANTEIAAYFRANDLTSFIEQLEASEADIDVHRSGLVVRIERRS